MDEFHRELCKKKLVEYEGNLSKIVSINIKSIKQYEKGFYAGFYEAFEILCKDKPELVN